MPTVLTPTREDLERLDEHAWRLYGDIATLHDATVADRRKAFEAAISSTLMLLDHERSERELRQRR